MGNRRNAAEDRALRNERAEEVIRLMRLGALNAVFVVNATLPQLPLRTLQGLITEGERNLRTREHDPPNPDADPFNVDLDDFDDVMAVIGRNKWQ